MSGMVPSETAAEISVLDLAQDRKLVRIPGFGMDGENVRERKAGLDSEATVTK